MCPAKIARLLPDLSISDAGWRQRYSVEYIDGKQVIHHDGKYQVMTEFANFR